jgi:hypothetical protein
VDNKRFEGGRSGSPGIETSLVEVTLINPQKSHHESYDGTSCSVDVSGEGYVLPQIFMTCELSMMPPLSNSGVVTWISRAFGAKVGECIGLNMLLQLGFKMGRAAESRFFLIGKSSEDLIEDRELCLAGAGGNVGSC